MNSPFDEQKYKSLLKGLEITIKNKSTVFNMFFNERIDAEFFKKVYLKLEKDILSKTHKRLYEIAFVTDGEHGNAITYSHGYSKYYGARNVTSMILNDQGIEYITQEHHKKLIKTELKSRDVLISCVGANIGCTAIVPDNIGVANIVRNVALIRSINTNILNEYLHIFLNTKYGKNLYIRMYTGNAQPLVSLDYIKTVPIFIPKIEFQIIIKEKTDIALKYLSHAQSLYNEAEELLLETIGLKDFNPSEKGTNIKSFKVSFLTTGRLDAEYYQSKYDEIEKKVMHYKGGFSYVSKQFKKNKATIDYSKKQYNYIEIGDVNIGDGSYLYNMIDITDLSANAKIKSKKGDLLISKVRPNRGAVSIINENIPDLVVSGAFTVLEERDNYKKEVLLVLLRTQYYREWLLKYNVGTSYPVIKDEDILNLPIPLLNENTQQQITKLIKKSFSLRAESEKLLEEAKEMVEKEIEGV